MYHGKKTETKTQKSPRLLIFVTLTAKKSNKKFIPYYKVVQHNILYQGGTSVIPLTHRIK